MKPTTIITDRHFQTWPSWQIVYEWEDEISAELNLALQNSPGPPTGFIRKTLKRIDNRFFNGQAGFLFKNFTKQQRNGALYFEMHPSVHYGFLTTGNIVPIIIDFWDRSKIDVIREVYGNRPYLLVTSLEVIDFFRKNQFRNRLVHFPMSLPSIYKTNPHQDLRKMYDIVLAGRVNRILWGFLQDYEKVHPEISYVYQVQEGGTLFYKSNRRGLIGNFHSRREYMELLRSARVSFYSTPGMDGGEARTSGFNPVTPRFFELLSAGCHVLARYPSNVDTKYFALDSICSSISTYEEFDRQLTNALHTPAPLKINAEYMQGHYTSDRIDILRGLGY